MADKIKSLDQDFIFGELDECAMLRAEIKRLRAEVKQLGEMGNVCTFNALGEICDGCRCERRLVSKPPQTIGIRSSK